MNEQISKNQNQNLPETTMQSETILDHLNDIVEKSEVDNELVFVLDDDPHVTIPDEMHEIDLLHSTQASTSLQRDGISDTLVSTGNSVSKSKTLPPPPISEHLRRQLMTTKEGSQRRHISVTLERSNDGKLPETIVVKLRSTESTTLPPPPIPSHLRKQLPSIPTHVARRKPVRPIMAVDYCIRGSFASVWLRSGQTAKLQRPPVCRVLYIEDPGKSLWIEQSTHADTAFIDYQNQGQEKCEICMTGQGDILVIDEHTHELRDICIEPSHLLAIAGNCSIEQPKQTDDPLGRFVRVVIREGGIVFLQSGHAGSALLPKFLSSSKERLQINIRQLVAFTPPLHIDQVDTGSCVEGMIAVNGPGHFFFTSRE